MVEVKYYANHKARRENNPIGVFTIDITPNEETSEFACKTEAIRIVKELVENLDRAILVAGVVDEEV